MNANQQSALAALRSVSPIAARLDRSRDGEDRAADILELWQGTETALRALAGGSSLGGQALIRELRQQELISLGQAYALLEFLGARDRANRTTYHASDNDVAVAREGFRQLETGLSARRTRPVHRHMYRRHRPTRLEARALLRVRSPRPPRRTRRPSRQPVTRRWGAGCLPISGSSFPSSSSCSSQSADTQCLSGEGIRRRTSIRQ